MLINRSKECIAFFDVSKQKLSQSVIIHEIGVGDSFCSIAVDFQESGGHEIWICYKAHTKIEIVKIIELNLQTN